MNWDFLRKINFPQWNKNTRKHPVIFRYSSTSSANSKSILPNNSEEVISDKWLVQSNEWLWPMQVLYKWKVLRTWHFPQTVQISATADHPIVREHVLKDSVTSLFPSVGTWNCKSRCAMTGRVLFWSDYSYYWGALQCQEPEQFTQDLTVNNQSAVLFEFVTLMAAMLLH